MSRRVAGAVAYTVALVLLAAPSACGGAPEPAAATSLAASCGQLTGLELADTTIANAELVQAGEFTDPDGATHDVPSFCRVVGVTSPEINFEVWLPQENWNGKFQGIGNGGMAGSFYFDRMTTALKRGYAAAATDTGHVSDGTFDATWGFGRPELVDDFGHRGLHLTTVNAKAIIETHYARPPAYSYYVGCSKGGQQGLMEAQRYPADYDGLIAGNPAHDWTRFYAGAHLWYSRATLADPESYIPAEKLPLLADAVNAACDAADGIEDGVLDDPRKCDFDPADVTCAAGQDPASCLTPKQAEAVRAIWSGSTDSEGNSLYPGLVPGGEASSAGWARWVSGDEPFTSLHWLAAEGFFVTSSSKTRTGTSGHSTTTKTSPLRSRRSAMRSTPRTLTSGRSVTAAASSSSITGGVMPTSRPVARSTTTKRSSRSSVTGTTTSQHWLTLKNSSVCSWRRGWGIAEVVPAPISSMR